MERSHVLADGGGRELAYVAISRARGTSHVYVVADDAGQAAGDLVTEWRRSTRQRWNLDTNEVASKDRSRRPKLARRTDLPVRLARLEDVPNVVEVRWRPCCYATSSVSHEGVTAPV